MRKFLLLILFVVGTTGCPKNPVDQWFLIVAIETKQGDTTRSIKPEFSAWGMKIIPDKYSESILSSGNRVTRYRYQINSLNLSDTIILTINFYDTLGVVADTFIPNTHASFDHLWHCLIGVQYNAPHSFKKIPLFDLVPDCVGDTLFVDSSSVIYDK